MATESYLAKRLEAALLERKWSQRPATLLASYIDKVQYQLMAIMPISILLLVVMGAFFQRGPTDPGQLALGLILATFGLTFFLDALRIAVLPLGELLGRELPRALPLWAVLAVTCLLGMECTYAEVSSCQ
jgi:hypothetical protein